MRLAGVLAISGVVGLAAAAWTLFTHARAIQPEVVWEAGFGADPPEDFLVVMFPSGDGVGVYAAPDAASERIGTLDRAMANAWHELDDAWIPVLLGETDGYVRRSDLSLEPVADRLESLTEALRDAGDEQGWTSMVDRVEADSTEPGGSGFVAREVWKGGSWVEYRWGVAGAEATPRSVLRWHETTVAMKGVSAMLISIIIGAMVFGVSVLVGVTAVLVVRGRHPARVSTGLEGAHTARR